MKIYSYEAKNYEEAIDNAQKDLKTDKQNLIILEIKTYKKILKTTFKIKITTINDVVNYLKDSLKEIINLMNIEANLEVKRKNNIFTITIFSSNNSILIGHQGKNIQALQNIIRQIAPSQFIKQYKIILDVENYKEKRLKIIEKTAIKIAKEVKITGIETKLEPMNSYERRQIHTILSKSKYVYTESVGEEPNRCIVIKPKE